MNGIETSTLIIIKNKDPFFQFLNFESNFQMLEHFNPSIKEIPPFYGNLKVSSDFFIEFQQQN